MKRLGITSKELAERLGKSPQYIGNLVNGGKNLSMNTLQSVAKALGVQEWRLLAPEEEVIANIPSGGQSIVCPYCSQPIELNPAKAKKEDGENIVEQ